MKTQQENHVASLLLHALQERLKDLSIRRDVLLRRVAIDLLFCLRGSDH